MCSELFAELVAYQKQPSGIFLMKYVHCINISPTSWKWINLNHKKKIKHLNGRQEWRQHNRNSEQWCDTQRNLWGGVSPPEVRPLLSSRRPATGSANQGQATDGWGEEMAERNIHQWDNRKTDQHDTIEQQPWQPKAKLSTQYYKATPMTSGKLINTILLSNILDNQ